MYIGYEQSIKEPLFDKVFQRLLTWADLHKEYERALRQPDSAEQT